MRSLDEFYKYIEKQEQALREQNTRRPPEPARAFPAPAPAPPPATLAPATPAPPPPAPPMAEETPVAAAPAAAEPARDEAPRVPEPPTPPAEIEALAAPAAAKAESFVPPPLPPRAPRPSRYESILPPEALRPDAAPRKNGHHRPTPAPAASDIRYLMRGGVTVPVKPRSRPLEMPRDADVLPDIGAYIPTLRDPEPEAAPPEEQFGDEVVAPAEAPAPVMDVVPVSNEEAAALWGRLPRHIQLLFSIPEGEEEVAQKYYTRGFKESRRELIERLLNPTLTLEEAARVLGVCPTTVRRYTNRGVLPHHRTVGQQRRFRLSDVLAFLERSAAGGAELPEDESDGEDNAEDAA